MRFPTCSEGTFARTVATAVVLVSVLWTRSAMAFKPEGHEAIEALAYHHLIHGPGVSCPVVHDDNSPVAENEPHFERPVNGVEVLRFLTATGVLQAPACFDVRADSIDATTCDSPEAQSDQSPVLGSGGPDDLYARQFGGNGQCFHFMAKNSDLWSYEDRTNGAPGVPVDLTTKAYARCVDTIQHLWDELLQHPEGSRDELHGLYALIHAVEDSFSAAHVERDKDWKVVYLKAWDVMGLELGFSWLGGNPDRLKYFGTQYQHNVVDGRDDDWRSAVEDESCPERGTPLELGQSERCFSPRGLRAADAVEELVGMTYCAMHPKRTKRVWNLEGPSSSIDYGRNRELWTAFLGRYFTRVERPEADFYSQHDGKPDKFHENIPDLLLGPRYRYGLHGQHSVGFALDGMPLIRGTYPFVPFAGIEPAIQVRGGDQYAVAFFDLGASIPIAQSVAIGASPVALDASVRTNGKDGNTRLMGSLRLDVFPFSWLPDSPHLQTTWVNFTPPRWRWTEHDWEPEYFSVAAGTAWDVDAASSPTSPGYKDTGLGWSPRDVRPLKDELKPRHVEGGISIGPQLAPHKGYGVRAVMPEILVRPRWSQWVEYGGALVIDATRKDEGTPDDIQTLAAGLAARFNVWPGQRILGIGITPIQANLGNSTFVKDGPYWSLAGYLSVFMHLKSITVSLDSVPLVFHDENHPLEKRVLPDLGMESFFLRFGWQQALWQ